MKRVVCFGDSNTWGYIPMSGGRYPEEVRYPGVLAKRLGEGYRVVEEGLCGRTTAFADLLRPQRAAVEHLIPVIISQLPMDYIIIMLGTNDTNSRFMATADDIGRGLENVIYGIQDIFKQRNNEGTIIVASPVPVKITPGGFFFNREVEEKSEALGEVFERIAALHGCEFIDLAKVTRAVGADGVHLSPEAHLAIGNALADKIFELERKES